MDFAAMFPVEADFSPLELRDAPMVQSGSFVSIALPDSPISTRDVADHMLYAEAATGIVVMPRIQGFAVPTVAECDGFDGDSDMVLDGYTIRFKVAMVTPTLCYFMVIVVPHDTPPAYVEEVRVVVLACDEVIECDFETPNVLTLEDLEAFAEPGQSLEEAVEYVRAVAETDTVVLLPTSADVQCDDTVTIGGFGGGLSFSTVSAFKQFLVNGCRLTDMTVAHGGGCYRHLLKEPPDVGNHWLSRDEARLLYAEEPGGFSENVFINRGENVHIAVEPFAGAEGCDAYSYFLMMHYHLYRVDDNG
jgi:hypothetical protein